MDERRDYAVLISLSMREEAEVVASALRADGIDAFIGNVNYANVDWGQTIALGGLQILVPRPRLAEAKEAIRARLRDAAAEREDDEPLERRDRYKAWLIIGGSIALGLLGIESAAPHQFDAGRLERSSFGEQFDAMKRECLLHPDSVMQVFDGNGARVLPCSAIAP